MSGERIMAILPELHRSNLEGRMPEWLEPLFWESPEQMVELSPQAQIGWFDMHEKPPILESIRRATGLRWLNTAYAGVDWVPLDNLAERKIVLSCGAGLRASQVAEYALMSMLSLAKGNRAIMRAQDRRDWLMEPAGDRNLDGSRALVLGMGAIGGRIARMLEGCNVTVEGTRSDDDGSWRGRLDNFDWIVMSLPGTEQTFRMIGEREIAAMKRDAVIVNVGRADTLDQDALVAALSEGRLAGAIFDVTDPEPLPHDHPLWSFENVILTMHLSGIPTDTSNRHAVDRFLRNCALWYEGKTLEAQVDLARGY